MRKIRGVLTFRHYRNGRLLRKVHTHNMLTHETVDRIFQNAFEQHQGYGSNRYMGLIDNVSYTGIDYEDAADSHAGWVELEDYENFTRQGVGIPAPTTSPIIGVEVSTSFSVTDDVSVKGVFIVDESAKGSVDGWLYSTAVVDVAIDMLTGDDIDVQYQFLASHDP